MSEFPATKTVHWASGPVFCCDRHAAVLAHLGTVMGFSAAVTHAVPDGAECINCKNEAAKSKP